MTEKTYSFKLKEEWDKIKYVREKNPQYVNHYLHYEGLLCLTDGQRYYLSPEGGQRSLPDLTNIDASVAVRRVEVSHERRKEKGIIQMAELTEYLVRKSDRPLEYWEFFLEPKGGGEYKWGLGAYASERIVEIYWDSIPSQPKVEGKGLTSEQKEIAYPVPIPKSVTPKSQIKDFTSADRTPATTAALVRSIANKNEEDKLDGGNITKLDIEAGFARLFLDSRYESLLEDTNLFLIINDKNFLISNLDALWVYPGKILSDDYFIDKV